MNVEKNNQNNVFFAKSLDFENKFKLDLNLDHLEQMYFVSPDIYNQFVSNEISQNTAFLKTNNLFNSFNKLQQKNILTKLLKLKMIENFDEKALNLANPVF